METRHVERYTIPLGSGMAINKGVTVVDLMKALAKLPAHGIVSNTFTGNELFVTYENDPIRT